MSTVRVRLLTAIIAASAAYIPTPVTAQIRTVASGLDTPWDLEWGPDGAIWVTERPGRVSRVDVATGLVTLVGEIKVTEVSESGLMGMAFHPDFASQPYVYLAHSYRALFGIGNRLIRMRYVGGRLTDLETLLDDIPGAGNHNGSRLAIGPDRMLYMTTGDAGDGSRSQDRSSLAGKVLRLTLDGKPAPGNPFGNAVWSYGHRNPQGIAFQAGTNALYVAEHGPSEADEVNLVEPGRNYGWPEVRGACDADAERVFCSANQVMEPVAEFTPTLGVAGAAFVARDTLLVTALSGRVLLRITLTPDGRRAAAVERLHAGEFGRIRDVLVGPDGAIYLATSNRDGRGSPAADDDRILRIR
ncbi:MAG: PQQ-dependent sugar dehydrogenase [Gemmatimonadetes bacterium]|nr:PQQ-dependent sugar dehydrogenase [Gemmatimonadota bacterium]